MARPRSDSPLLFDIAARPDFAFEAQARKEGAWPVAGLDEAGRGPLAGPVVAAAVILDPDRIPDGLDDSKRLTEAARDSLFDAVLGTALAVGIASLSAESIDRSDILRASLEAMRRALRGLTIAPRLALVDGNQMPPGLPCPARTLVKGDQRSQSIAAASILAKVLRDRMMHNCGRCDGRYGFELHKGYATGRHRDAIAAHGPAGRLHRLSFAPFRLADPPEAIAEPRLMSFAR